MHGIINLNQKIITCLFVLADEKRVTTFCWGL